MFYNREYWYCKNKNFNKCDSRLGAKPRNTVERRRAARDLSNTYNN